MSREEAERALRAYAEANGLTLEEALREVLEERFAAEAEARARDRLAASGALDDELLDDEESLAGALEEETAEDLELDLWWRRPPDAPS